MLSHRRLIAASGRRRLSEPPSAAKFFSHLWHRGALSVTATVTHLRHGPYWSHDRAGETVRILPCSARCIEPEHATLLRCVVPRGREPRATPLKRPSGDGRWSPRRGRRTATSPGSSPARSP